MPNQTVTMIGRDSRGEIAQIFQVDTGPGTRWTPRQMKKCLFRYCDVATVSRVNHPIDSPIPIGH